VFDKEPPNSAADTVTFIDAFPEGFDVTSDTVPLVVHVTKILGLGVPLDGGFVMVPPETLHDILVLEVQLPLIVYWYDTPACTQVGPVIDICDKDNLHKKSCTNSDAGTNFILLLSMLELYFG